MEDLATREAASIHVTVLQVTVVIAVKQVGYYQTFLTISHSLNVHQEASN